MPDLSIAEYGELYAHGITNLLDKHEEAVKAADEERITDIRAELMAVVAQLVIAAAAHGRTMSADEAKLVFAPNTGMN